VVRPRAADDFATICARLEELRCERNWAERWEDGSAPDPLPMPCDRIGVVVISIRRLRNAAG
jgi:hypothetical protein